MVRDWMSRLRNRCCQSSATKRTCTGTPLCRLSCKSAGTAPSSTPWTVTSKSFRKTERPVIRRSLWARDTTGDRQSRSNSGATRAITRGRVEWVRMLDLRIGRTRHYIVGPGAREVQAELRGGEGAWLEGGDARLRGKLHTGHEGRGRVNPGTAGARPTLGGEGPSHGRGQLVVEGVPPVLAGDVPAERPPQQVEIAHQVEDLVTDELILEAEAVVEDGALPDHHRVVERAATGEPVLPHRGHVLEEAVGARRRQLVHEGGFGHLEGYDLLADDRMGIVERVGDAEGLRRRDLEPAVAVAHPDGLAYDEGPARGGKQRGAGRVEEIHEWLGAAIEGRHLLRGDVHDQIVDAERGRGRHEVLDGAHADAEGSHRGRRAPIDDMLDISGDQGAVSRAEENAGVGGGWSKRELNRFA